MTSITSPEAYFIHILQETLFKMKMLSQIPRVPGLSGYPGTRWFTWKTTGMATYHPLDQVPLSSPTSRPLGRISYPLLYQLCICSNHDRFLCPLVW